MNRQTAKQVIEEIEAACRDERERAIRDATCFIPDCLGALSWSHVIAKKFLRRIAESSHVLTWPSSDSIYSEMIAAIDAGKSLEHSNMEPVLVGIGDTERVAYPLFCHPHDEQIFMQIEKREIAAYAERIPKQVFLLAYRSLCSSAFQLAQLSPMDTMLEIAKMHSSRHSLHNPERYARMQRFMAKDIMVSAYQRHEQVRKSGDYSQLGYALYILDVPPCLATTYSFIPVDDEEERAIVNGTLILRPEDLVHFTFLPHQPLTTSVCVISPLLSGREYTKKREVVLMKLRRGVRSYDPAKTGHPNGGLCR